MILRAVLGSTGSSTPAGPMELGPELWMGILLFGGAAGFYLSWSRAPLPAPDDSVD